jgi:protein-ribulosamine 3-kinase
VLQAASDALEPSARGATPAETEAAVGGGCIHPARRIRGPSGRAAFLKWSPEPGRSGFGVEARGLRALRDRGGVPVPEVLGWDEGGKEARGWLLLEWIEPGSPTPDTEAELGRGLARLHEPLDEGGPGWEEEGWIGSLPQGNRTDLDWPAFWAAARLAPRWRHAREAGRIPAREEPAMDRLLSALPRALAGWETDGISLLHGDLWSGNVLVARGGSPYLVDPAVYRGHREVDLAMMELFGGFGPGTFRAYEEVVPLRDGYAEIRRGIYQLYPLLVHVNLFGGGYAERTLRTLERALAELY